MCACRRLEAWRLEAHFCERGHYLVDGVGLHQLVLDVPPGFSPAPQRTAPDLAIISALIHVMVISALIPVCSNLSGVISTLSAVISTLIPICSSLSAVIRTLIPICSTLSSAVISTPW